MLRYGWFVGVVVVYHAGIGFVKGVVYGADFGASARGFAKLGEAISESKRLYAQVNATA